jgi:hypothetical protein
MENQSLEVAKTIHQQLIGLGRTKVWSWGANSWTAIKNGLSFRVQGFKFKGVVQIVLMPSDTYTIQFIKGNKLEKEYSDVYFDEQVDIIDNYVEFTGANYASDVKNSLYNL